MRLLDTIALIVIDREGISVEIDGELFKNRIREFLVLQDPRKSQFRKSWIQGRRGGRLCENLRPVLIPRCDLFEVCREENLAIFEIADKNRAASCCQSPRSTHSAIVSGWGPRAADNREP